MSIDREVDKEDVVDGCREILVSQKREWKDAVCSGIRMDLEMSVRSEGSQAEKDKYHVKSLTCAIVKRYR